MAHYTPLKDITWPCTYRVQGEVQAHFFFLRGIVGHPPQNARKVNGGAGLLSGPIVGHPSGPGPP